jgi:ribonuclease D
VTFQHITTNSQLKSYCDELASAPVIAFDTEFVSERSYRPQLCLIQVAALDRVAIIDPLACSDIHIFWERLITPGHETLVHSGREELNFCLQATRQRPANMFDVQIAAGLVSHEYPSGYAALLDRHLGIKLDKGETRTDWSIRPLTQSQMEYAVDDVKHLLPLRQALGEKLEKYGRVDWMHAEMEAWENEVDEFRSREHWRKISGANSLSRRAMGVMRGLWLWREEIAVRRNQLPRRVLRDDLMFEIAKRRNADVRHIQNLRGMERGDLKQLIPEISNVIQQALALPDEQLPSHLKREQPQQYPLLGQLLNAALTSICRSKNLATALVGTASDIRDLIAFRLGINTDDPPLLARGWRATVVGNLIEELLSGKTSIRIHDPHSDDPLVFE